MSNKTYIDAMRKHIWQYRCELNDLYELISGSGLDQFQYRAAERSLQITIEACIGIAKHWAKSLTRTSATSTQDAFEKIHQHGFVSVDELTNWRKIIGLRNALVHDYLNVDPAIVRTMIANRYTDDLFEFAERGLNHLESQD